MLYRERICPQGHLLPRFCGGVIALIAPNWVSCVCKLRTDLMVPPREEGHVQKRESVMLRQPVILKRGILCAGGRGRAYEGAERGFIFADIIFKPCICLGAAGNYCGIALFCLMGGELRRKAACGLACARKHHNPANRPVQTVHKPKEHVPGLVVFLLYVAFYKGKHVAVA